MRRQAMVMAGVGTVAAVVLGACGSGGQGSTRPGASNPKAAVAADPRLHGMLPAEVQKAGKLIMATDATIGAPFASFGPDDKTVVGLNADLAKALGQVLGIDIDTANTPFGTFIPGLQAKRYDVSVSVMLDTKAREQVVDFVDYIKDGTGFLVRSGDPHDNLTPADLCGMKAAAISGSVEQNDLETQSRKCTAAGRKPITVAIFAENAQGMLALTSSRVDVWVGDSDQNAWFKQQNHGALKQSGAPFNTAIDGIAVLKDNPIVPAIQKALQELMDNGTYNKILQRYGVQDSAISTATLNHAQY